jgi:hypothetical protein
MEGQVREVEVAPGMVVAVVIALIVSPFMDREGSTPTVETTTVCPTEALHQAVARYDVIGVLVLGSKPKLPPRSFPSWISPVQLPLMITACAVGVVNTIAAVAIHAI